MKNFTFLFSEKKRTISRIYGGSNYTLNVYEVINNEPKLIGEVSACTRGHKGEESEAFGLIIQKRPEIIKLISNRAKRILKKEPSNYYASSFDKDCKNSGGYYSWNYKQLGLIVKQV